jgi:rod shape-determining protein MreC
VEHSAPPFFKQGPSALARLLFFSALSLILLFVDTRMNTLMVLRQGIGGVLYPLESLANSPRDLLRNVADYFGGRAELLGENEGLKQRQLELARASLETEQLAAENAQLRKLLDARERVGSTAQHAQVLYDARDPYTHKVIIDRGSRHGIKAGQPAIDDRGVLGQVVRVFNLTAEVALITDRDQSIPVQDVRNGLRAVAYGGTQNGTLELRYMAGNADVQAGDLLVTSGIDGIYPPGLPVARVMNVVRDAAAFARITCVPMAGVREHPHLLVLALDVELPERPPEAEVIPLMKPGKKPKAEKASKAESNQAEP